MKRFQFQPIQLRGLALLALLIFVLGILGAMVWRNLNRFETFHFYVSYSHRIQGIAADLAQGLTDFISRSDGEIDSLKVQPIAENIRALAGAEHHLDPETPQRLRNIERELSELLKPSDRAQVERSLVNALSVAREIIGKETDLREELIENIRLDMRTELQLALLTLAALLIFTLIFFRHRILAPLTDLRELLTRLSQEDFQPFATAKLDPLLLPVFNSYNDMVKRLIELEDEKRRYATSLEAEVRNASKALLEQQVSLARAERLAAMGELTASIAHELRNPLAGIQMGCGNLRQEITNPDQAERLDLIIDELKRMKRLLNDLLAAGRSKPVPASDFDFVAMVREFLALARYQIPANVEIACEMPDALPCRLPESNMRQVLLNLLINAAQSIDDQPGRIVICVRAEETSLVVSVADDGPGFPDALLQDGIRPFATDRPRGTGLGLAVVKRVMQEIGGQISLSNLQPYGACVTLKLPGVLRY